MMIEIKRRLFSCVLSLVMVVGCGVRPVGAQIPKESQRKAAAEKALKNLARQLGKDGLQHPSGNNGEVVVYATAGLAFLASGSTPSSGPYKKEVAACAKFVMEKTGSKDEFPGGFKFKSMDQSVWGYAHSTIFLSYLNRSVNSKTRKLIEPVLKRFAETLVKSQTSRGGWCHSLADEPNPLDYTDFVATTNLALFSLGVAKAEGIEVPAETFKKGLAYLVNSSNDRGHVGYSPRSGQRGNPEAGRTAGAILAFRAMGATKHRNYRLMLSHLSEHLGAELNKGHGSAQLGLMQAGWACQQLGSGAWKRFWAEQGAAILSRQQSDGAIVPAAGDAVFGKDTDSPIENGDRSTATHALILLLPEGHLGRGKRSGPYSSEDRVAVLAEGVKLLGEDAPESAREFLKAAKSSSGKLVSARRLDSLFRKDFSRVFADIGKSGAEEKLKARVLIAQLGIATSVEAKHDPRRRSVTVEVSASTSISGVNAQVLFELPKGSSKGKISASRARPSAAKPAKFKKTVPLTADFSGPLEIQVTFVWSRGKTTFESSETVTVEVQ